MRATCVICQDLFADGCDVSATPCGHTFHTFCLRTWLDKAKNCPQCRQKAPLNKCVKLYFDCPTTDDETPLDPEALHNQVQSLELKLKMEFADKNNVKEENDTLKFQNKGLKEECKFLEGENRKTTTTITAMKSQLRDLGKLRDEMKRAKEAERRVCQQLETMHNIQKIQSAAHHEIELMIENYAANSDITGLVTTNVLLNKQFSKVIEDKNRLKKEARNWEAEARKIKSQFTTNDGELENYRKDILSLENENKSLKKKIRCLEDAITSPSGDVKNSVINRFIHESPRPTCFKRTVDGDDVYSCTPEVVSRSKKIGAIESQKEKTISKTVDLTQEKEEGSPYLQLKSSSVYNISKKKPIPIVQLDSPTSFSFPKYDLFKGRPLSQSKPKSLSSRPNTGYDGLGGHHKVDIFPKPKLREPTKLSKKPRNPTPTKQSIKDFFKNTFDD